MFADRARIMVRAGAGGDGASTFRREAHVPRGGPDGGDGGDGGDVVLVVEAGMTTLGDFKRKRHFRAGDGGRGMGRRAHGRNGADLVIRVPPGTVVRSQPEGEWIGELVEADARLVAARAGRGGRGNVHFASATHRAPKHAEKGTPGEERWIELELKLIADIGLVGAPNAGKSTLLAALTEARPEVGAYPFTTVTPNLGVIALDEDRMAVIADVPGLIEGAHEGRGLGHHFLRHVERTRVLVGVVDGAAREPLEEWRAVAEELRLHDPALAERPMPLVVTKLDLPEVRDRWPELRTGLRADGHEPIAVSAHDGTGLEALRARVATALDEAEARVEERGPEEMRVHRFDPLAEGWEVVAEGAGYRVRGRRIETAAARTDFENEESRDRFWRLLERQGIDLELRRQGAGPGALVRIGDTELEWGRGMTLETGVRLAGASETASPQVRRIGVLGGTFDPPHVGHLWLAALAADALGLDRVLFMPAAQPPHKGGRLVSRATDRLVMTRLAIAGDPTFELSAIEMERPGPSYTIDSVEELQGLYGAQARLVLVMAADSLAQIDTWREPDRLLARIEWAVGPRPGFVPPDRAALETRFGANASRIHVLSGPSLDVSSSEIRRRVAAGHTIRYLVPRGVEELIADRGLYRRG